MSDKDIEKFEDIVREIEEYAEKGDDIRVEVAWRANGWRQYTFDIWPVQNEEEGD